MAAERNKSIFIRSRLYFNPRPTRYRPAAVAKGTPVAPHCVKSLRSARLIMGPVSDVAGVSRAMQKRSMPRATPASLSPLDITALCLLYAMFRSLCALRHRSKPSAPP